MKQDIERSNWLDFACIILALAAVRFNVIDGIAAIRDSSYVANQVLFANLHAWGWFFLAWGVLQLFAPPPHFVAHRGGDLGDSRRVLQCDRQLVGRDESGLVGHDPGAGCDRYLRPRHERSVGQRPAGRNAISSRRSLWPRATTSGGGTRGIARRNSEIRDPADGDRQPERDKAIGERAR